MERGHHAGYAIESLGRSCNEVTAAVLKAGRESVKIGANEGKRVAGANESFGPETR